MSSHGTSTVRRRPVTTFVVLALVLGLGGLSIPAVMGLPFEPFLLVLVFVALLGSALLVTWRTDGSRGVRRLLARVLIWRFSPVRWAVILFAMPVLTIAIAAGSGTLVSPEGGWPLEIRSYLLSTVLVGALFLNIWEETAWAGFMQSRLMARHGLLVGALVTAPVFAAVHIPLHFDDGWTWSKVGTGLAILFALAPVYRYLLGMHLLDTHGSLLAVGIQHAAWNASINLESVDGDWQAITAVVLLTLLVAVGRRLWHTEDHPSGREMEKLVASRWFVHVRATARTADPV
jgi:membrane protease YdiL (CAAX protease family)